MQDINRYHCVDLFHHRRDDNVILIPNVCCVHHQICFGDGQILPRSEATAIGQAVQAMLEHCRTADVQQVVSSVNASMQRRRAGIELSFEEQFPQLEHRNNHGMIYQRYPALLMNPWIEQRHFTTSAISDNPKNSSLKLAHLILKRRNRGIYTPAEEMTLDASLSAASLGLQIAERLGAWQKPPGLLARFTA